MLNYLSKLLLDAGNRQLYFHCPGCGYNHSVIVEGYSGPATVWGWNGDAEKPTFTPSILVKGRQFTPAGRAAFDKWHSEGCPSPAPESFESRDTVCHSFITDGNIQFLGDCTHALAGQTVPLPPHPQVAHLTKLP